MMSSDEASNCAGSPRHYRRGLPSTPLMGSSREVDAGLPGHDEGDLSPPMPLLIFAQRMGRLKSTMAAACRRRSRRRTGSIPTSVRAFHSAEEVRVGKVGDDGLETGPGWCPSMVTFPS